ncbi:hypothetical protein A6A06_15525 [Streptomyces sp. CB02923]|uniref:hypothetical protein n=1 Tax=Streptomyces sp. CB02923 TaxID=1718985 RepID=UPI0009399195|nr:hypothetical protein [Streptomyces sp. CB02923]OKI02448.1 hypothetical protein A6A06_15525 [Streptomyces sp. CB02923]
MPYVEWRGTTCRVKWWSGEYLENGRKKYESESGFDDEEIAYDYGLDRGYEVRHGTRVAKIRGDILMLFGMLMTDAVQRYKVRTESPVPVPAPRRGRYVKKVRKRKRPLAMGPVYQLAVNAYTVWGFTG